jgi:ribosome-binding factor A
MKKGQSASLRRFESDMYRLLTTLLQREIEDPMLLGISLTRFELLDANGQAIAYVHSMIAMDQKEAVKRLNKLCPHFLHILRKSIPKKRLPDLVFRWDDALDKTHRVMDTMAGLRNT